MPKKCRRYAASETLGAAIRGLTRTAKRCRRSAAGMAAALTLASLVGCSSGPNRIEVPDFDPDEIGLRAIEQFDTDGDGNLSAAERSEVKSLDSAMRQLDANGDKKLSADEIAARIHFYQEYRAGLIPVTCTLVRGGRPVIGATVTYEPEKFMSDSLVPAVGTTDNKGGAAPSVAAEHLPSPVHSGIRPGFYRVRVTLADGVEVTGLNAGAECAPDSFNDHRFVLP